MVVVKWNYLDLEYPKLGKRSKNRQLVTIFVSFSGND
jgi:hypothetical protein